MNIDVQTLIPLFVALPLAVALLIQLVARGRPVIAEWLANTAMLALVLMSCYTIGRTGLYHLGGWPTPIGIDMRLDELATLLLMAVNLMLFSLVHNPCSTTIYTIYKETGSAKWTAVASFLPLVMGFVLCFLVAQVWRLVAG